MATHGVPLHGKEDLESTTRLFKRLCRLAVPLSPKGARAEIFRREFSVVSTPAFLGQKDS
jgi:hypothetical protein